MDDDGALAVEPGDVGNVLAVDLEGFPTATVIWERTGRVYDIEPCEVEVLAEADFATRAETTPKKTRREFVRRGSV